MSENSLVIEFLNIVIFLFLIYKNRKMPMCINFGGVMSAAASLSTGLSQSATALSQGAAGPIYNLGNAAAPVRQFHLVSKDTPNYMRDLTKIFNEILVPLYGPQEKALSQISLSTDRTCYLLYEGRVPVGVIVFKTVISNEFANFGITDSIEIKSLFVVASGENSGRGIGSLLLDKIASEVEKLRIKCNSLHVTVSEDKTESLNFFRKKGFSIMHTWDGRYFQGKKEHLLRRLQMGNEKQAAEEKTKLASLPTDAAQALAAKNVVYLPQQPKDDPLESTAKEKEAASAKQKEAASIEADIKAKQSIEWSPKVLTIIKNAHWDDIHALKLLSDGTFISGSKDNTLRKWNDRGEVVREVYDVEPDIASDSNWITAIGIINDEYWISGNRAGKVSLWNTAGDFIKDLSLKLPKDNHVSYEQNRQRINCLVGGTNKQKPSFFGGFPTMFSEYNVIEGRTTSVTPVHKNDWVYCIHPLNERRNLVVTAGTLEVWEKTQNVWNRSVTVYKEKREEAEKARYYRGRGGRGRGISGKNVKKSRPHIAALTQLASSPKQFALGLFGGSTAVVDIDAARTVREWKEHLDNVWCIENVSRDIFASSSGDGSIKFWDTRLDKSVTTLGKHVGCVSAMLKINDHVLVAGACPKNPKNEGGQLLFYDIRRSVK